MWHEKCGVELVGPSEYGVLLLATGEYVVHEEAEVESARRLALRAQQVVEKERYVDRPLDQLLIVDKAAGVSAACCLLLMLMLLLIGCFLCCGNVGARCLLACVEQRKGGARLEQGHVLAGRQELVVLTIGQAITEANQAILARQRQLLLARARAAAAIRAALVGGGGGHAQPAR